MLAEIMNIDGRMFLNTPFLQLYGIVAKNLCERYIPDGAMVMAFPAPAPTPWDIPNRSMSRELTLKRKDDVPSLAMKIIFIDHKANYHEEIEIYADG